MEYFQWLFWAGMVAVFTWTQWQQQQRGQQQHQQHQRAGSAAGGPAGAASMGGKLEQMQQMMLAAQRQQQQQAGGAGDAAGALTTTTAAASGGGGVLSADGRADDPAHDAALREVVTEYLLKAEQHRADMGDRRVTVEHVMLALAEDRWFGEVLSVAEGLEDESLKRAVRKSRVIHGRGGVAGSEAVEGGSGGKAAVGSAAAAGIATAAATGDAAANNANENSSSDNATTAADPNSSYLLGGGALPAGSPSPPNKDALSLYGRDLTELARQGKLDPVVGRAEELRRVADVLCRRTKNSAVLVGDPGVGKTACVEGLAQRIAVGDVPDALKGCSLIALDLALLGAGASFPGEFEERMLALITQLQTPPLAGKALLFIDDLHAIAGPNAQQGGGVNDASMMLKPLLGRGEVRVVGCTTADKFRRFIEKDPALERRFQQVALLPPSVQETVSILRGLRKRYELHHGVRIADAALLAAASLTERYLPDRCLPDKAIDAVDEACAKVRTDLDLKPEALDALERRAKQLSEERRLLARAADAALADSAAEAELEALDAELADLKERSAAMAAELEEEIRASAPAQELRDALDALDAEIEAAEESGDSEGADGLRAKRRGEILRQLRLRAKGAAGFGGAAATSSGGGGRFGLGGKNKKAAAAAAAAQAAARSNQKLTRAEVAEADVARVVSKWTGIPLTKLVEAEAGRLLSLAQDLKSRVVGQSEAVAAVADAVQRARAGMKDPDGPIASFLFLGPTGVGKTELAKALATALFSSEDAMVRLDMSEYMEKHSVAKLIGAPPGYVGYDDPGQLTEAVRRRPYCVVLFDEVEKAHVDIFALLLQILDDGRVTDSQGRLVSFKNAIIILTSNLGSAEIFQHTYGRQQQRLEQRRLAGKGGDANAEEDDASSEGDEAAAQADDRLREVVMARVRKHFAPEFVNRLDECIIFEPLTPSQIAYVVRLKLKGVSERLAEKKIALAVRDGALKALAASGYDPVYGARPVKRAVQRMLETPLAKALLTGLYSEGDTVVVDAAAAAEGAGALSFFRVPALPPLEEDEEEEDGDGESKEDPEAAANARRERKAQRAAQRAAAEAEALANPEPVDIPGYSSSSGAAGGKGSAAARRAARLRGGASGGVVVPPAAKAAAVATPAAAVLPTPPPPATMKFDPLAAKKKGPAAAAKKAETPPPPPQPPLEGGGGGGANGNANGSNNNSAPSPADSTTEAASAMLHLDADDVPSFLKPAKRRDAQDESLPTCAE